MKILGYFLLGCITAVISSVAFIFAVNLVTVTSAPDPHPIQTHWGQTPEVRRAVDDRQARLDQARADLELSRSLLRDYAKNGRQDIEKQRADNAAMLRDMCRKGLVTGAVCD